MQKELGEDVEVYFTEVIKNNDTRLEAIALKSERDVLMPVIYLKQFYEEYTYTNDFEASVSAILSVYKNRNGVVTESRLPDWKESGPRIRIRLVKREGNNEYLKNAVYRETMDLAVIFGVEMEVCRGVGGKASVLVTEAVMDDWGISSEELYRIAMENLKSETFTLTSLTEIISQEYGLESDNDVGLYVLTTEDRFYGARALLRKISLRNLRTAITAVSLSCRALSTSCFYIVMTAVREMLKILRRSSVR